MHITELTEQHLAVAAELFNHYRIFYEQASDVPACHAFVRDNW